MMIKIVCYSVVCPCNRQLKSISHIFHTKISARQSCILFQYKSHNNLTYCFPRATAATLVLGFVEIIVPRATRVLDLTIAYNITFITTWGYASFARCATSGCTFWAALCWTVGAALLGID